MRQKILLADRVAQSTQILGSELRAEGFQVIDVRDGASALAQARERVPSLIALDAALPDISGFEVCRRLQADESTRHIQVIILSAAAGEEDRVRGFEVGADDFIGKPFSVREVILRIKKSLERITSAPEPPLQAKMRLGPLSLDSFRHEVTLNGAAVHLTPIEFQILELLMRHLGGALSRRAIHQNVWSNMKYSDSRTMDAHIKRLREKLGSLGREIETLTGFGYRLKESLATSSEDIDPSQMKLNELVFAINRMNDRGGDVPGLKKKLNAILALK